MNLRRLACVASIVALLCAASSASAQSAGAGPSPTAGVLPAEIPLFPLEDVMLFPHISRVFQIFEPRYRAMVADAIKGDHIIGMVLLKPGYEANYEGKPPVFTIGCAGVITDAQQLPDGRYIITVQGLMKFDIESEDQTRAYRLAKVQPIADRPIGTERAVLHLRRNRLIAMVATAVPGAKTPPPTLSDEDVVNGFAQYLELAPSERQNLLEREGPLARAGTLIDLLAAKFPQP